MSCLFQIHSALSWDSVPSNLSRSMLFAFDLSCTFLAYPVIFWYILLVPDRYKFVPDLSGSIMFTPADLSCSFLVYPVFVPYLSSPDLHQVRSWFILFAYKQSCVPYMQFPFLIYVTFRTYPVRSGSLSVYPVCSWSNPFLPVRSWSILTFIFVLFPSCSVLLFKAYNTI